MLVLNSTSLVFYYIRAKLQPFFWPTNQHTAPTGNTQQQHRFTLMNRDHADMKLGCLDGWL